MPPKPHDILGPAVAGSWYPAERAELADVVDSFLAEGSDGNAGTPTALIAPHAGYMYSGAVAGAVFARLKAARYNRVILIGPSHYESFTGAVMPSSSIYRTPLGDTPIDRDAIDRLCTHANLTVEQSPFLPEHCLEAELPFLQRVLGPTIKLLPILLGNADQGRTNHEISEALRDEMTPDDLLVVSSDFVHYGPRFDYVPFEHDIPAGIKKIDTGAIEHIVGLDRGGFKEHVSQTGATICGRDAIDLLLRLLPTGTHGTLVTYDTSSTVTGSWDHSVSYAGLVFENGLKDEERSQLLGLARTAIEAAIHPTDALTQRLTAFKPTPGMTVHGGVFVTLRTPPCDSGSRGELRGCIGNIVSSKPLYQNLIEMAPRSALHDPRFSPLTADELAAVQIEISVLSPLKRLERIEELVIGRDGLQLTKGAHRALFLPQVATDQGWALKDLLEHLAQKAGLDRSGWQGAEFEVFQAEHFNEISPA
jgi:AmmeMemoRadiSam system protein B/AmmeMemoRadiSam system protein A